MFAALEHEEEGTKDFVGDGDDGAFVAAADDENRNFDWKTERFRLAA